MPDPDVSVVVACYNAEAHLAATLRSILASDIDPARLDVVAVDDASSDRTWEVLGGFAPRVRRLRAERNGGPSRARNLGIGEARGAVIALCDHDDLWEPEKLRLQLPLLTRPRVGLVCSDASVFTARGVVVPSMAAERPLHRGMVLHRLLRANFVVQSSALLRRQDLLDIGGFDEGVFPGEDLDLWLRVAARWEIDFVPRVLVHWRLGDSNYSHDLARMHEARLEVIRRACARHCGEAETRQVLAHNHRRYGRNLRYAGLRREGRAQVRRALALDPWAAATWRELAASYLPAPAIGVARSVRRLAR